MMGMSTPPYPTLREQDSGQRETHLPTCSPIITGLLLLTLTVVHVPGTCTWTMVACTAAIRLASLTSGPSEAVINTKKDNRGVL